METQFKALQAAQHITDRANTLGNFALASAAAPDWPKAIDQLKEAISACGQCDSLAPLHKDLGLIYCRSGDYKNGRIELLAAQKLAPTDEDVKKALNLLESVESPTQPH